MPRKLLRWVPSSNATDQQKEQIRTQPTVSLALLLTVLGPIVDDKDSWFSNPTGGILEESLLPGHEHERNIILMRQEMASESSSLLLNL